MTWWDVAKPSTPARVLGEIADRFKRNGGSGLSRVAFAG
jgi:hypothetical protein